MHSPSHPIVHWKSPSKLPADTPVVSLFDGPLTAFDISISALENQPVVIHIEQLLDTDIPSRNHPVKITDLDSFSGGNATLLHRGQDIIFSPLHGFLGIARLRYTLQDTLGNSALGTISIWFNQR